jgi:hypothetical protein
MRGLIRLAAVLTVVCAAGLQAGPALAADHATIADIQRLESSVYDIGREVTRARSRDAQLAARLETELDDLRDEVIYLKVKMRKEGTVTRVEHNELRDKLDALRARARGETTAAPGQTGGLRSGTPTAQPAPHPSDDTRRRTTDPYPSQPTATTGSMTNTVPVGTELDVRLQTELNSGSAQVEDRFEATTIVDLNSGDQVLIPSGSVLRGVVTSVDRASRTDRKGSLTVAFDQINIRGRSYPIRATVTQALESEGIRGEAARIGTGAGVGAVIGGILGGFKGALAGILIGGGGTVAATEGKDVDLDPGTILRVRLDSPLAVR